MINQHVSPRGARRTRLIQSYRFSFSLSLCNKHHLEANLTREHPLIHPSSSRDVSWKDPPPHGPFRLLGVFFNYDNHIDQGEVVVFVWEPLPSHVGYHRVPFLGLFSRYLLFLDLSIHFYADDAQICVAKLTGCGPSFSP